MRGEFLDVGGIRLYYYAAGSRGAGEPIVLIHGFPTSGHLWRDVVPLLPAGHRVVVVDLLGYGRSDPPRDERVDIRSHADRLVSVLDQLRIEDACLVGHGIGGGVAQSLITRWPHRVSRLCLISSVAFDVWPRVTAKLARFAFPVLRHIAPDSLLAMARMELLRGFIDRERGAHDLDLFFRPFTSDDGRDAFAAHVAALESSETAALAPKLSEITAPTAIVWGEHDPFLPQSVGARLTKTIPGSTLEVAPGARHFVPQEAPAVVATSVRSLLLR